MARCRKLMHLRRGPTIDKPKHAAVRQAIAQTTRKTHVFRLLARMEHSSDLATPRRALAHELQR
jgi:hypothetical protein